jgi:hypothetical protein
MDLPTVAAQPGASALIRPADSDVHRRRGWIAWRDWGPSESCAGLRTVGSLEVAPGELFDCYNRGFDHRDLNTLRSLHVDAHDGFDDFDNCPRQRLCRAGRSPVQGVGTSRQPTPSRRRKLRCHGSNDLQLEYLA